MKYQILLVSEDNFGGKTREKIVQVACKDASPLAFFVAAQLRHGIRKFVAATLNAEKRRLGVSGCAVRTSPPGGISGTRKSKS
jgi:hypothetical protein